jgi:mannosyltransferase
MLSPDAALTENSPQANSHPEPGNRNFVDLWLLGALVTLAAVLRSLFLTRKSFWFDEGVSVQIARLDWYNFVRLLWRREGNMSLYYLLLRGWLHLGHSEAFIRSISVIASVAAIPAIYWLGRRLFDSRTGLLAATLLTLNAYHVRYAQEARSYSLFVFLAILSCIYFLRSLEDPSRPNRLGHILTSALAVYAHFFAFLLIIAQWISLRFLEPRLIPSELSKWSRHWKTIGLVGLPALLFAGTTGVGPLNWIKRPGIKMLYEYYEHMAGNAGALLLLAYAAACSAILTPLGRRLFRRDASWATWRCQFLLLWLLFPMVFTLVVSIARPMFVARYFIFCLPAFILLASAGLVRIPRVWLLAPALIVFAALSLKGTLSYYDHDFDLDRDDWRSASYYVLNQARPGDVVIFHIAMGRMPYEFYKSVYTGRGPEPTVIYPARGDRIDYRDFMGKPSQEFLQSVPAQYDRVWVVLKNNQTKTGDVDSTTLVLSRLLGTNYATRLDTSFPGIEVRFYGERRAAIANQATSAGER